MPFISGAPESLIPRSDSKNPATTCKGITSSGRPCRRSLAAPRSSSRSPSQGDRGVLAVLPNVGENNHGAAAFFCWQHKDQVKGLASQLPSSQVLELKGRNSIDTLVERLGVIEIEDKTKTRRDKGHATVAKAAQNQAIQQEALPQQWQEVSGPLITVPEEALGSQPPQPVAQPQKSSEKKRRRRNEIHLSFFCCMRHQTSDSLPPARPQPSSKPQVSQVGHFSLHHPPILIHSASNAPAATPSQTSKYLSFIPPSLSPATTSLLLTELAKPLTTSDHEPGYIYMFWLTPNTVPAKAASAASSLLTPSRREHAAGNVRRTSDVLRDYAETSDRSNNGENKSSRLQEKTIMLKIGRASNVHRRMNEWTRQCGHHITLLRFYPYPAHKSPSASPSPSPSPHSTPRNSPHRSTSSFTTPNSQSNLRSSTQSPQKAPLIPRVERLIHLELQDKRVKRLCDGCGKEHREWFEVEPSRDAVRSVNDCVARWVNWAIQETSEG